MFGTLLSMHCRISFMTMTSVHVHVIWAWSFIFSSYKHLCTRLTMHTMHGFRTKITKEHIIDSPHCIYRCSVQLTSLGPLLLLVVGPRSDPRHSASRGLGERSWSLVIHPPKKNSYRVLQLWQYHQRQLNYIQHHYI